jgi:hypothetical protein
VTAGGGKHLRGFRCPPRHSEWPQAFAVLIDKIVQFRASLDSRATIVSGHPRAASCDSWMIEEHAIARDANRQALGYFY